MSYRGRDGLDYDSELAYLKGLEENWETRANEKWQAETERLVREAKAAERLKVVNKVWVIEHGEYENRGVFGVAETVTAAISHIKRSYGYPFVVRWEEAKCEPNGSWSIQAYFEAVPEYSTTHKDTFEITCYQFATSAGDDDAPSE